MQKMVQCGIILNTTHYTLNTRSPICDLQWVPHKKTSILENSHRYFHVLHIGKIIWEDEIITEGPRVPCKCNTTYTTDETSGEIH